MKVGTIVRFQVADDEHRDALVLKADGGEVDLMVTLLDGDATKFDLMGAGLHWRAAHGDPPGNDPAEASLEAEAPRRVEGDQVGNWSTVTPA